MDAKVAKILGDNLDSNGTMVLFGDLIIEPEATDTGLAGSVAIYSGESADDAVNVKDELVAFLNEQAKSHDIIFRPKVDGTLLGYPPVTYVPIRYASDGDSQFYIYHSSGSFVQMVYNINTDDNNLLLEAIAKVIS